jgi:hypothetical protein
MVASNAVQSIPNDTAEQSIDCSYFPKYLHKALDRSNPDSDLNGNFAWLSVQWPANIEYSPASGYTGSPNTHTSTTSEYQLSRPNSSLNDLVRSSNLPLSAIQWTECDRSSCGFSCIDVHAMRYVLEYTIIASHGPSYRTTIGCTMVKVIIEHTTVLKTTASTVILNCAASGDTTEAHTATIIICYVPINLASIPSKGSQGKTRLLVIYSGSIASRWMRFASKRSWGCSSVITRRLGRWA